MAKSSQGKEPDRWPRDPHGYILLARLVEKIGAAMHSDYTGEEATTKEIDLLPRSLKDATSFHRQMADILLTQRRSDLWIIERWHFDRSRIDPDYPNGDRPSSSREDNDHWIFATSKSVELVLKQVSNFKPTEIENFVKDYFKSNPHPTMDDCVDKWPYGSSARDLLRETYRNEAKNHGISVKRGPRKNSEK